VLSPERCLEGCQHDSPPRFAGSQSLDGVMGHSNPTGPAYADGVTNRLGADGEVVTRRVWVPPRSDAPRRGDATVAAVVCPANLGTSAEFGVPVTSQRGPVRKPAEDDCRHPHGGALFDDNASSRVTLRAGGLVSLGAGALGERSGALGERNRALGERGGALGERRACAVCGARRAAWCVRGGRRLSPPVPLGSVWRQCLFARDSAGWWARESWRGCAWRAQWGAW